MSGLNGCVFFRSRRTAGADLPRDRERHKRENMEELLALHSFAATWGWLALPFSCCLMFLSAFMLPIPAALLTVVNCSCFGLVPGLLLSWGCSVIGAGAAFLLSRCVGQRFVLRFVSDKNIERAEAFMLRHGKGSIFLARALPCVPFGLVSYAAGLTSVRFIPYFLSTAAGKIFPTLLYGLLGSALLTLPPAVLPAACAAICLPFLVFFRSAQAASQTPSLL